MRFTFLLAFLIVSCTLDSITQQGMQIYNNAYVQIRVLKELLVQKALIVKNWGRKKVEDLKKFYNCEIKEKIPSAEDIDEKKQKIKEFLEQLQSRITEMEKNKKETEAVKDSEKSSEEERKEL